MRGGGRPLPKLKNTIYTFIFDGRKRCTSCPKEGEGGEVIWAMPERKHSFLKEVFPQMFNESVQVYESFCPDVKRLKIVLEMFQCAMPLMLFNICHIFVSQISKHLMFRRLNVALSKGNSQNDG